MSRLIRKSIETKYKTNSAFEKAAGMRGGSVGSLLKTKRGVIGKVFGQIAKALELTPKKLWEELEKAPPIKELDDVAPGLAPAQDDAGGSTDISEVLKTLNLLPQEPTLIIDVPHLGKIELGMASGKWAPVKKKGKRSSAE
jgi:hypothetical protein